MIMAPKTEGKREKKLFARVSDETFEATQRVADVLHDGNLSVLVRVAVKQYVERQQAQIEGEKAA